KYDALVCEVNKAFKEHKISEAARELYTFIWNIYCDWYLEMVKPRLYTGTDEDKIIAHTILITILERILRLIHPIMPFITEDIWQLLPREHNTASIMITNWPNMQKQFISKKIDNEMEVLISVIQAVRNLRATWHIEPMKEVDICIKVKKKKDLALINENKAYINKLACIKNISTSNKLKKPRHSAVTVKGDIEIFLPLEGIIDLKKEKNRLKKKLGEISNLLKGIEEKLKNKNFISKAPKQVVEKEKKRAAFLKTEINGLKKNLKEL
ncbi:MAG: class I tRNA ligase family protein, partial [Candidatus Omnitrophica bacterium]|nr:class I tRNA ligase family protein [Candidatus Omnitrophota bacterium]